MLVKTTRGATETGIWTLEELQQAVDRGEVLPTDHVQPDGFSNWLPLAEIAAGMGIKLPMPPPPPTEPPVPPKIPVQSAPPPIPTRPAAPKPSSKPQANGGFPWLRVGAGVLTLSILAAIVVPAYRDYRSRAAASYGSKVDSTQSRSPGVEQQEEQQPANSESTLQISLENDRDRVSYMIGMRMGAQLSSPELKDELDMDFVEKGIRDVLDGGELLFDEARAKEIGDRFSERIAMKVQGISSVAAQKSQYEDSGSQECIEISRKLVAAKRRNDVRPYFDNTVEMAQLENFRGPFLGCAGGESREEKEYLAQHPQPSNEQPRAPETESPDQEAPSTASNVSYAIPPTTDSGNFAVDVGSFGSAEMADQMIERLANVNLPAYLEPTKLNGGDVSRVLIGRFEDRSIAESARQHAKEAVGIDAEVIELRAE